MALFTLKLLDPVLPSDPLFFNLIINSIKLILEFLLSELGVSDGVIQLSLNLIKFYDVLSPLLIKVVDLDLVVGNNPDFCVHCLL